MHEVSRASPKVSRRTTSRSASDGDPHDLDPSEIEALWRRHLGELLDSEQVRQRLRARTPRAVDELVKRRQLLGLATQSGHLVFPAFQFAASGRTYPALPAILEAFAGAVFSPYTVASWFVTPEPFLEGETPARWLQRGGSPARVEEAARQSAAQISH